jgi:uncharacterized protein with GYD domain
MARYLFEVSVVPQAFATLITNPQDRAQANRPLFEAVGGTLEAYYFAVGQSLFYLVAEIPDEASVGALTMAILAGGAVASVKSTAILTAAEAVEAMRKAATLGYRPHRLSPFSPSDFFPW